MQGNGQDLDSDMDKDSPVQGTGTGGGGDGMGETGLKLIFTDVFTQSDINTPVAVACIHISMASPSSSPAPPC